MTETLSRPSRPVAGARRTPAADLGGSPPPVLAGVLSAAVAALVGLLAVTVPVLLVAEADDRSTASFGDALRTGAQAWLVAHGADLDLPGGTLGLAPLGLVAVPALALWRAGRRAADALVCRSRGEALQAAALVAVPYAAVAGVVATVAETAAARPLPMAALLHALALALVVVGAAALRGCGAGLPEVAPRLRAVAVSAGGALLVLLGAAALLVAVSLALDLSAAADVARATAPGVVGGAGLLLLGLALVPNAVVWAASWLGGPGFAVGAGTAVSPFEATVGPLPALPLAAALPGGEVPAAAAALAVPLLAGVVAGWLLHRRGGTPVDALVAGGLAGTALAVLAWASGGPAGGERLAQLGPAPLAVGGAFAVAVAVGAAAVVAVLRHRAARA